MFYLVNDNYKYIILCYPKSGSSTLRLLHIYMNSNQKKKNDPLFEDKHHNIDEYTNFKYKKEYDSYYKVIVYRNPYERLCSIFYQKICGIISLNITENNKLMYQPQKINAELNTFDKCIDYIILNKIEDIHFYPQQKNGFKYDEIIEINNITNIFKKNKELNNLVNEIISKHNLNYKNYIKKYDLDSFRDLHDYNFHKDTDKLLKKHKVPAYKYLLNEKIIRKIKDNYKDDFLDFYIPII